MVLDPKGGVISIPKLNMIKIINKTSWFLGNLNICFASPTKYNKKRKSAESTFYNSPPPYSAYYIQSYYFFTLFRTFLIGKSNLYFQYPYKITIHLEPIYIITHRFLDHDVIWYLGFLSLHIGQVIHATYWYVQWPNLELLFGMLFMWPFGVHGRDGGEAQRLGDDGVKE